MKRMNFTITKWIKTKEKDMFGYLKIGMLGAAFLGMTFFASGELNAAPQKAYRPKTYSSKSYYKSPKTRCYVKPPQYSKKAPYSGYGKRSKVNGLPKTKITSGHVKRTSKGYTYVNPYARSK